LLVCDAFSYLLHLDYSFLDNIIKNIKIIIKINLGTLLVVESLISIQSSEFLSWLAP